MSKLEMFLENEWENDKELHQTYDDLEDYKNFMLETIEQYKELQEIVDTYKGTLEEFIETLEFGWNNYEENKYVDFNYGNLTCTVNVIDNKLVLSNMVEIWNDRFCALVSASFNISKYLDKE